MKKIKYLGLGLIFSLACVSCNDWLDVNENPNTPTNTVASVETRCGEHACQLDQWNHYFTQWF